MIIKRIDSLVGPDRCTCIIGHCIVIARRKILQLWTLTHNNSYHTRATHKLVNDADMCFRHIRKTYM